MQVKIRLQRFGSKKRPFYRIVAAASANKRDGRFLEILGLYHPIAAEGHQYRLDKEKIFSWLNKGAQPSAQVKQILSENALWKDYAIEQENKRVVRLKTARTNRKAKAKPKQSAETAQPA